MKHSKAFLMVLFVLYCSCAVMGVAMVAGLYPDQILLGVIISSITGVNILNAMLYGRDILLKP